jgi:hypothetical protein
MTINKRLILVEVYIDTDPKNNDLDYTENEIFEEVVEDFQITADSLTASSYFVRAGITTIWLVPDTGDCS